MKKILSFLLVAFVMAPLFSANVLATEESFEVYVTISDENGCLVLANEPVTVSDADGDGTITINDALLAAHEAYCKDGYAYTIVHGRTEITKLWGVEYAEYGCCVDGSAAWRVTDPLAEGDYVQAFIYTDTENASDAISYFTKTTGEFKNGKETMKLFAYVYTAEGNLLSKPVSGAIITVNGKDMDIVTDENGEFTVTLDHLELGEKNVISARSENILLVPPVFTIDAGEAEAIQNASTLMIVFVTVVVMLLLALCVFVGVRFMRKKRK